MTRLNLAIYVFLNQPGCTIIMTTKAEVLLLNIQAFHAKGKYTVCVEYSMHNCNCACYTYTHISTLEVHEVY